MSLISKQNSEAYFFDSFLKRAIDGDERYLEIVKPIILEAARFARKQIDVFKLDRKAFSTKLYLSKIKAIKKVTPDNLMLPEIRKYILDHWEDYSDSI